MGYSRKAIIVVHGMGNQMPMSTIREFAENVNVKGTRLYSSPDRIVGDLETRRLSFKDNNIDYYEFYWAHLMQEPTSLNVWKWTFKLLFLKTVSDRARKMVYTLRIIFFSIIFTLLSLLFIKLKNVTADQINFEKTIIYGIMILAAYKLLVLFFRAVSSTTILQSIGDVVKYTLPTPQNIDVRNSIRNKGIEMLNKLHEVKDSDKDPKYNEIIVVGHSLGSIVAYDMLTFLFPKYHNINTYDEKISQEDVTKFAKDYYDKPIEEFDLNKYQEDQIKISKSYRQFKMPWRVSNFITMGSPLTHAVMVMANSKHEFYKRKMIREFPTCPPVPDINDDNKCFFNFTEDKYLRPHHAALFALTRWTNIYFSNDYIGGNLSSEFGIGIRDIELKSQNGFVKKYLPFASHTSYWGKKEIESIKNINNCFDNIPSENEANNQNI
jgi:hypothetical protein